MPRAADDFSAIDLRRRAIAFARDWHAMRAGETFETTNNLVVRHFGAVPASEFLPHLYGLLGLGEVLSLAASPLPLDHGPLA